jgi:hypothetical protein
MPGAVEPHLDLLAALRVRHARLLSRRRSVQ